MSNLPDIPSNLVEFVAIDEIGHKLYVEKTRRTNPLLLTWLDRANKANEHPFLVVAVDIDEIVNLRASGMRSEKVDKEDSLKVRLSALDLIKRSAELRGSDVHILLKGTHAEVQVRLNGELKVLSQMTQQEGESISRALFQGIATIKDSTYNPLEFQNAQISGDEVTNIGLTSVRLVRGPAFPVDTGGGFAILRLQYGDANAGRKTTKKHEVLKSPRKPPGELRLGRMGYTEKQVGFLKLLARAPSGVIMFTGPTGSGKTTGLYEMLTHSAREFPEKRLVTIEDPVEYPMPWAVQMVVTNAVGEEATGDAFSNRLRAALRMDPDNILIGELRGADSAIAAINAALTGHQVWTTLHVTDPYLMVDRLELMDNQKLNRRVFCDHKIIRGVIAQRLVPRLCDKCSVPLNDHLEDMPDGMVEALKTYGSLDRARVRGPGCESCNGESISGRMAIAEVVVSDAKLMRDFLEHGTEIARKNHRMRDDTDDSITTNAVYKVLAGEVDPRDAEKIIDVILPKGQED